jgi:uncharacterized membrane protein
MSYTILLDDPSDVVIANIQEYILNQEIAIGKFELTDVLDYSFTYNTICSCTLSTEEDATMFILRFGGKLTNV